jgi:hypothetical protein
LDDWGRHHARQIFESDDLRGRYEAALMDVHEDVAEEVDRLIAIENGELPADPPVTVAAVTQDQAPSPTTRRPWSLTRAMSRQAKAPF